MRQTAHQRAGTSSSGTDSSKHKGNLPSSKGDLSSNVVLKLYSMDFDFVDDEEVVSNFTFPLNPALIWLIC